MSAQPETLRRDSELAQAVRRYENAALLLPDRQTTWTFREVELSRGAHTAFASAGVIEQVDELCEPYETPEGVTTSYTIPIWRVTERAVAEIQRRFENRRLCPNGQGTGFRTIDARETYTCLNDECNCRFGPEIAEAMIQ